MNKQSIKPAKPKIFSGGYTAIFLDKEIIDTSAIDAKAKREGFRKQTARHITILGDSKARIIKSVIEKLDVNQQMPIQSEIKLLLDSLDWSFIPKEIYHITRTRSFGDDDAPAETRQAYILTINMPSMEEFYQKLNNLLNINLPAQFPHITLFTKGERSNPKYYGIPIASIEEFNNCSPKLTAS